MSIQEYYADELHALRVLGAEFSRKNPGLSTFLARKGQDPDVERLLEGFAFLTGRLRQYMDEELPEVSHALAQLLWPNLLRPIPSFTIISYDPSTDDTLITVPKGEEVMAIHPKTEEPCTFVTCYETRVSDISLNEASYHNSGDGGVIELDFSLLAGNLSKLSDLKYLRFYIGGHEKVSYDLYLYLLNYIDKAELVLDEEPVADLGSDCFLPVGFEEEQTLLPLPSTLFFGHNLLQEFFCYREKFLFLDLNLQKLKGVGEKLLSGRNTFTIRFLFSRKMKLSKKIGKDHFKLYCTPVVNVFKADAEPIRKRVGEEFEVIPAGLDYRFSEVYAVTRVEGWDSRIGRFHRYAPFESFGHYDRESEYYYTRVKLSEDGLETKTYISFAESGTDSLKLLKEDITVSIEILATNKDLPSSLELGAISLTTPRTRVSNLKFRNISIPTKSYPPPMKGDFLWRVISNMAANYFSLESVVTLRSLLESYDFIGVNDDLYRKHTEMLLDGITKVDSEIEDMIFKGLPIRGSVTRLELDAKNFSSIGEAYLLLSIINEFLSLYSTINSFHRLEATVDKRAKFSWPAKLGRRSLM